MDLSQLGPQVDSQTRSAAELARPPANEDTAQRNLEKKIKSCGPEVPGLFEKKSPVKTFRVLQQRGHRSTQP
tara:strand:+ start:608 stop:823 length:216 start_codon:yes stop_codon:yes gene_type:complete